MTDLNEQCRIPVMCIATNPYGRSEQYFALSFNSSENNCFQTSASETFSDSTVIIALTVLIVIVCLALLLIIIFLMYMHKRRAKSMV